jgi:hypothetical protein
MHISSEDFCSAPSVLYRVFNEEKWAFAFIERGSMRLKSVPYFARLEDNIRADPGEGTSLYQIRGTVIKATLSENNKIADIDSELGLINYRGILTDPIYIYCFSYPPNGDVSLLPRKFGNFVVRIDDPKQLIQDIKDFLEYKQIDLASPLIEYLPIVYNEGSLFSQEPDILTQFQLLYTQKSASFSDQYEYRLAILKARQTDNKYDNIFDIELGKRLTYATLLAK